MENAHLIRIVVITLLVLILPLIAMQFSDQVDWNLADFILAGGLLIAASLGIEFVKKKFASSTHQTFAIIVLGTTFLLIWAELGVGIIGTPWAGS